MFLKFYSWKIVDCRLRTKSSAIAGRPCNAKACQGLLKWTWKWQPRLKWPSNVLQGHQKWSFKVINFGIAEEPLTGYIAQCNKCGLRCEDAKACQGLLKWTWKWQPRLKWPSNVLQGHQKWSFKVINFGIAEEPLTGYIAQCNKCGLRCEDSKHIASESSLLVVYSNFCRITHRFLRNLM